MATSQCPAPAPAPGSASRCTSLEQWPSPSHSGLPHSCLEAAGQGSHVLLEPEEKKCNSLKRQVDASKEPPRKPGRLDRWVLLHEPQKDVTAHTQPCGTWQFLVAAIKTECTCVGDNHDIHTGRQENPEVLLCSGMQAHSRH